MALRGMDILIEEKLSEIRKIEFIEKAIVAKFHILGNSESENLDLDDAIRNIEWYAIAYKSLAANQADGRNAAILQRKIALCHLEDHALADATEAIRQAQLHEHNSAANFYILFHIAMEKRQIVQGSIKYFIKKIFGISCKNSKESVFSYIAIQHLHEMCKGDEFHGNMLTMAAHEAYQKGNKAVLIEALKEILEKHEKGEDIANRDLLQQTLASIEQYKKLKKTLGKRKRSTLDDDQENKSTAQSDMILIILFEFEAKIKLGLWNELLTVLDASTFKNIRTYG
ncbi:3793_t:CDS:2 [Racocetra fulgida]|uniref:3793_t:CDS:1 n=1 Tax=Racocetra fulgida TaxID=60492 RepID=A0A9N9BV97_9GLOM|nr:3793_t:CDS:2 [Racocetra fulgida]